MYQRCNAQKCIRVHVMHGKRKRESTFKGTKEIFESIAAFYETHVEYPLLEYSAFQ
jgi:hypothetical protein